MIFEGNTFELYPVFLKGDVMTVRSKIPLSLLLIEFLLYVLELRIPIGIDTMPRFPAAQEAFKCWSPLPCSQHLLCRIYPQVKPSPRTTILLSKLLYHVTWMPDITYSGHSAISVSSGIHELFLSSTVLDHKIPLRRILPCSSIQPEPRSWSTTV